MRKLYLLIAFGCLLATNAVAQTCSHAATRASASRGAQSVPTTAHTIREDEYDVKFYFLDLDINKTNYKIEGNVLVKARTVAPKMDTFSIELSATEFTVDSVYCKRNAFAVQTGTVISHTDNDLNIDLPFQATGGDDVEIRIFYHGTAATSFFAPMGPGFFEGANVFSASPPYNSSTWWPCKQNLTDKADSSWFFITADTSSQGISNGVLTDVVDVSPTKKRWEWKSKYPINFYLISFVVGKYNKNVQYFQPDGRTDSMPVEFYGVAPGATMDILQKFSDKFGLYPFYDEKFGLAAVTLGGGMENQTIVSLGAAGSVIEHETMHQWFGDNVSMASFRDLALSEGFARWGETLYPELTSGTPNATRIAQCTPLEVAAVKYANGSVYNHTNDTSSIAGLYSGQGYDMYYNKAAMVINSLRFEIDNDSLFFLGLKNYQTQYAGNIATGNDLRDVMENTTGMDLTDFFNQWYHGYGYPSFGIKWNHKNNTLAMQLTETTSSVSTPLFKTSLEITVKRTNGTVATDTTVRVFMSSDSIMFFIPMGDSITGFTVDPNQWIANKTSFVAKDASIVISGIQSPDADAAFQVYPNPASQYLHIRSSLPAGEVIEAELYNTIGERVRYAKFNPSQPLSVAGLPDGVYFLHINRAHSYKVLIVN